MDVALPKPATALPLPQRLGSAATWFAGLIAGLAVHLLFAFTVWHLFWFLRNGPTAATHVESTLLALGVDALLAIGFAVPHSLLLWPPARKRLGRYIAPQFYGLFYSTVTCVSLLSLFWCWQMVPVNVWQTSGNLAGLIHLAFYLSWVALFYSLWLTGLGYQTGLTPWLGWLRGKPPARRGFAPQGAYRVLRHPVYVSFLGLVWFVPTMTIDHAILTAIWTIYLLIGSYLKDERLAFYLGESYRDYQRRVVGWPGMFIGPLARRR